MKLERLWQEIEKLVPKGIQFGSDPASIERIKPCFWTLNRSSRARTTQTLGLLGLRYFSVYICHGIFMLIGKLFFNVAADENYWKDWLKERALIMMETE